MTQIWLPAPTSDRRSERAWMHTVHINSFRHTYVHIKRDEVDVTQLWQERHNVRLVMSATGMGMER